MAGVTISPSPTYLKVAAINVSSTGANALVAGVTGMRTQVFRVWLNAGAANTITFQDGTTSLSGPIALAANSPPVDLQNSGDPWFVTSTSNAFNLSLGAASQVSGMLYYTQTPSPPFGS